VKQETPTARVRVFRYNPATDTEPHYEDYAVPLLEGMSIMNALKYVAEHHDPGLAFYVSCRYGLCGGCAVKVNGRNRMACLEPFVGDVTLEPVNNAKVIKDLLVSKE